MTVKFFELTLSGPLMNAGGTCKRIEGDKDGLETLVKVEDLPAIEVGSATMDPRGGNPGNVLWFGHYYSLNALGLPNPGMPYYSQHLRTMVQMCHDAGKLLFFNIAGVGAEAKGSQLQRTPTEDYERLAIMAAEAGVDMIVLNFGCPNVWGGALQKPIVSFDFDLMSQVVRTLRGAMGNDILVGAKFSPYSNPLDIRRGAELVRDSLDLIQAVLTTNTFPNGFAWNTNGGQAIEFGTGLAGMGGPAMKGVGLGQVRQWRALLDSMDRKDVQIIGVGGVETGQDVTDYLQAGAALVQVASTFVKEGPGCIARILEEHLRIKWAPIAQRA